MDNETLQAIRLMLKEELKEELEPIKNDIQGLKEGQGRLETKFINLETKVDNLEVRFDRLELGQQKISDMIEELDPMNATRHIDIIKTINELRDDMTNIEIITSSNWNEIAKLKKVK